MNSYQILVLIVYAVLGENEEDFDKRFCSYDKRTAICSGNMTYIPRLPHNIFVLKVWNANLTNIEKSAFNNLTHNIITKLNLSGNYIHNIHPQAFCNINHLRTLAITNEPRLDIINLKTALDNMKKDNLKVVHFNYNRWGTLPKDMFHSFGSSRIRYIYLISNELVVIYLSSFRYLKHLGKLILTRNFIKQIYMHHLPYLRYLKLDHNRIEEIPNFCDVNNESYIPKLDNLVLNKNYVARIHIQTFNCLPKLQTIKLKGIPILRLRSNIFANLHILKSIWLNDLTDLEFIEDFAFNCTSCLKLSISNNKIQFHRIDRYNPNFIFAFCRHLSHLYLQGNSFLNVNATLVHTILSPLVNLQVLNLAASQLIDLPLNLFPQMKNLRTLDIRANSLNSDDINHETLGNMSSLKSLDISANVIALINERSFSQTTLSSLRTINLARNGFSCTCELKWFVNWIKSTHINIAYYPSGYKCRHPAAMHGILLKDYNPTEEICNPWDPMYTVAISLTIIGIITFGIIIVCVKCQINITNYIYLIRVSYNQRNGNVQLHDRENYKYHAFVVYCETDSEWVHNTFVRKMENEANILLCIHQRDFDIGETIIGNIDKYLRTSWKVVVVMSNDFAKSEWCQWEVDVILERRRHLGRDVLVLIMLTNIDTKHMTSQLKTLLESTPYLRYQNGVRENLFWKAAVKSLQRPIGHSPIAVLDG